MKLEAIVDGYLKGLEEWPSEEDREQLSGTSGAGSKQLRLLSERFSDCPDSLLELLSYINGTYWQTYCDKEVSLPMLGSDVFEYPYYLKSVEQILAPSDYNQSINEIYSGYQEGMRELIGEGVNLDVSLRWK